MPHGVKAVTVLAKKCLQTESQTNRPMLGTCWPPDTQFAHLRKLLFTAYRNALGAAKIPHSSDRLRSRGNYLREWLDEQAPRSSRRLLKSELLINHIVKFPICSLNRAQKSE